MIHDAHHLKRLLLLAAVEGGLALVRHVLIHYFLESSRGLKQRANELIVFLVRHEGGGHRLYRPKLLPKRI